MALGGGPSDKEKHLLRLFVGGLEANKHATSIPLGDLDITRGSGSYSGYLEQLGEESYRLSEAECLTNGDEAKLGLIGRVLHQRISKIGKLKGELALKSHSEPCGNGYLCNPLLGDH